ncbi:hypothetical protein DY000_02060849 [Brassica cretica]|uniref:Uncharacterized protein n=1 Tax=Brassica cretica TaxID=69181 RepID=A0ABQ7B3P5_BRACR|nr:hypothetical protein DY000_02060849 [Brassica cretica]
MDFREATDREATDIEAGNEDGTENDGTYNEGVGGVLTFDEDIEIHDGVYQPRDDGMDLVLAKEEDCKWFVRIAKLKNSELWTVRSFINQHTCFVVTTRTLHDREATDRETIDREATDTETGDKDRTKNDATDGGVLTLHEGTEMHDGFSDLEDVWDDLPVSLLKYNALTDLSVFVRSDGVFSHVSPFHNRSERFGFSDLEDFWDDLPVSRLKYNALDDFREVFQATSSKFFITWFSSSIHLRFFRSGFGYAGFSDLEDVWDDLPVSRLKYNALTDLSVFVRSDGVFSHVYPFHNRSERFGF